MQVLKPLPGKKFRLAKWGAPGAALLEYELPFLARATGFCSAQGVRSKKEAAPVWQAAFHGKNFQEVISGP
jgi:hypothetical protein